MAEGYGTSYAELGKILRQESRGLRYLEAKSLELEDLQVRKYLIGGAKVYDLLDHQGMEEVEGDEGHLEARVDDLVGLQGGYQDVEDPEKDEYTGGDGLVDLK